MSSTVGDVLFVACDEENLFKITKRFIRLCDYGQEPSPTVGDL